MADDVTITPGSGVTIATDDIGSGRQVQLIKPVFGPDGSATMVDVLAPMPVQDPQLNVSANATATGVAIASQDLAGYHSVQMILTGTFTATAQLQMSPDNSTWTNVTAQQINASGTGTLPNGSGVFASMSSAGNYYFQLNTSMFRYVRVNISAYTSGTVGISLRATRGPAAITAVNVVGAGGTLTVSASSGGSGSDTTSNSFQWAQVGAANYGFNGSTWYRARFPNAFKSITATASGDTAVWTPTSGKRFQLLKFQIFATSDAAQSSGGVITVKLRDVTTDIGIAVPVFVPTTGGTTLGGWSSGWIDIGPYGYRSSAINQALNVNLSAALTAGAIGVIACGTEE